MCLFELLHPLMCEFDECVFLELLNKNDLDLVNVCEFDKFVFLEL